MAVKPVDNGVGYCFICQPTKTFPGNEVIAHMFAVHYSKESKK